MNTLCRDCVFAKRKNGHQFGCEFNRIDKFKENGGASLVTEKYVAIKEVVDAGDIPTLREYSLDEYNHCKVLCQFVDGKNLGVLDEPEASEESSYYNIPRYCNKCRNSDWAEKNKGRDLITLVNKEATLDLTFLIYIDKDSLLMNLKNTIECIKKQVLSASKVILVDNFSKIKSKELTDALENCGTAWQYLRMHEKNMSKEWALDEAYLKLTSKYFAQIELPCEFDFNFVANIDKMINEDLVRIALLTYPTPNIFVSQVTGLKTLHGNAPAQLKENGDYVEGVRGKIEWLAKENDQAHMVHTCSNL